MKSILRKSVIISFRAHYNSVTVLARKQAHGSWHNCQNEVPWAEESTGSKMICRLKERFTIIFNEFSHDSVVSNAMI